MKKSPDDVMQVSLQKRTRFRLLMTGTLDGELSLEQGESCRCEDHHIS